MGGNVAAAKSTATANENLHQNLNRLPLGGGGSSLGIGSSYGTSANNSMNNWGAAAMPIMPGTGPGNLSPRFFAATAHPAKRRPPSLYRLLIKNEINIAALLGVLVAFSKELSGDTIDLLAFLHHENNPIDIASPLKMLGNLSNPLLLLLTGTALEQLISTCGPGLKWSDVWPPWGPESSTANDSSTNDSESSQSEAAAAAAKTESSSSTSEPGVTVAGE